MTLPYTNTGDLTKVRFTCENCVYPSGAGCGHVWIADADEHYVENHTSRFTVRRQGDTVRRALNNE